VQLKLVTDGFTYQKWGEQQHCKPNDWLVDNNGDVYTVDADSFALTYTADGPGTFFKTGKLWAVKAQESGRTTTKEGATNYQPGDWLVSNHENGSDSYAISAKKFEELYELDE